MIFLCKFELSLCSNGFASTSAVQVSQQWARKLKDLLETINCKVIDDSGVLDAQEAQKYRLKYKAQIKQG